jgi:hypothetical protein
MPIPLIAYIYIHKIKCQASVSVHGLTHLQVYSYHSRDDDQPLGWITIGWLEHTKQTPICGGGTLFDASLDSHPSLLVSQIRDINIKGSCPESMACGQRTYPPPAMISLLIKSNYCQG